MPERSETLQIAASGTNLFVGERKYGVLQGPVGVPLPLKKIHLRLQNHKIVTTKPSATKSKPFPVSNAVLVSIWKERKDLQKLYPEVAKGNLTGLTRWAKTTGWIQSHYELNVYLLEH